MGAFDALSTLVNAAVAWVMGPGRVLMVLALMLTCIGVVLHFLSFRHIWTAIFAIAFVFSAGWIVSQMGG